MAFLRKKVSPNLRLGLWILVGGILSWGGYRNLQPFLRRQLLIHAIENHNVILARKLLLAGTSPDIIVSYGVPLLKSAIDRDDIDFVRLLLDAGANPNTQI